MKKIVVLGGGISGVGAALLAKKNGYDVFLSDKGIILDKKTLTNNNIKFEEGIHTIKEVMTASEVVKSPVISDSEDLIKQIKDKGISVISEIEFASRFTNSKIIAITGTNGKTTTTLLLGHILEKEGYDVLVAGNIGTGFAKSIAERDYDYIILEVSSFQLDGIKDFKPDIAILLNITPDHLDRYQNSFENYIESKLQITKNQDKNDVFIYNYDDINIRDTIKTKAKMIPFSLKKIFKTDGAFYDNNEININLNNNQMTIQDLALQGKHNVYNSMAAAVASRVLEVRDFITRQSLQDFRNIAHRLEHVINVHGIEFINDSKATNINSVWFALESMHKEIVWIAGGVDKGNNYEELIELVKEKVKSIVCIGQKTENIHNSFKDHVDNIVDANSMNEAVGFSYQLAEKGDVVLLSPACASFDMFKNFEHRGEEFKKCVRSL